MYVVVPSPPGTNSRRHSSFSTEESLLIFMVIVFHYFHNFTPNYMVDFALS